MISSLPKKPNKEEFQKQAERLRKLYQPKGAFQSQKPRTEAVDVELREIQKREEEFNFIIQRELNRLNFPLTDMKNMKKPISKKIQSFGFSLATSLKSPNTIRKQAKTPKGQISPHPRSQKRHNTPFVSSLTPSERPNTQPLPALIKSTPIHQDPNMRFSRIKRTVQEKLKKFSRLNSIELVINKLDSMDKNNRVQIDSSVEKSWKLSRTVYDCVNTLHDCQKFGVNTDLQTIVHLQNDAMRLTEYILQETNQASRELNESIGQVLSKSKRSRHASL